MGGVRSEPLLKAGRIRLRNVLVRGRIFAFLQIFFAVVSRRAKMKVSAFRPLFITLALKPAALRKALEGVGKFF